MGKLGMELGCNWGTDFCDLRGEVDVAKWAAIINFRRSYHGGRHSRRDSDISKKAVHIAVHIAVEFLFFPPFLGLFRYEGILGIRNCPRKALNQSLRFGGTAFLEVNQFLLAPCVFVLSQFCDA